MLNFQQSMVSGGPLARETNNNLQFYVNRSATVVEPNSNEKNAKESIIMNSNINNNNTSPQMTPNVSTTHSALNLVPISIPSYHPNTTSLYGNNKREMTLKDRIMKKLSENNNNNNNNQISSAFLSNSNTTTIRNEDQENAFRQIETVHNYAKSSSSPKSSVSSYFDDDDEDDDENSEDEDLNAEDHDLNMDCIESLQKKRSGKTLIQSNPSKQNISDSSSFSGGSCYNSSSPSPPSPETATKSAVQDHHTRRPMNVFLIFCKRHREIVRDKHKTLENR